MLTQCPNCQTMFRVTSEILRVADGQVRCGRCQRQFDALERLIEETDDEQIPSRADIVQNGAEDIEVEEPASHEDITMEGRHIEISGTYRVPDRFGNGHEEVQQETIEEWVEIDDLDADQDSDEPTEDVLQEFADGEASVDEPVEGADDEEPVEEPLESEDDAVEIELREMDTAAAPIRATGSPRFAYGRRAPSAESSPSAADDLLGLPSRRESSSRVWGFLVLPLALLLIVQWVHSYRATLARHPTIGPTLLATYRTLGVPLTPNWDLHAYQIRQWGVVSDPAQPGTLRVRASVTNLADFAQPYPMLKLVLEDRWGEQIRAREFQPSEYLDPTISPDRMLNPGQQANATIAIVDPGPDAEGFRFDVCLRGSAGSVCADEIRRR